MSKTCQNCGKPMADDMRFCQNCGAPYQAPAAPQQPQYQAPQQPQYQAPQQPQYQAPQQPQYQAPQQPQYQAPQQPQYQAPQQPQYQPQQPQYGYGAPQQGYQPAPKAPKAPKQGGFDINKLFDQVKIFANGIFNRCKTDKKFMGICIGGAAAALIVIILLFVLLNGSTYTKPIDYYIDVAFEGKSSSIKKMAPADYWEWYEDETDEDLDDYIDDYEDDVEDMIDYYEDEYGKNYRVTYKVKDKKELSDKKVEGIGEALADKYDLDEDKFTAGYDLELEVTIKGSEDDDENDIELSVIKYKGSWYLINWSKSGSDYYASFYID